MAARIAFLGNFKGPHFSVNFRRSSPISPLLQSNPPPSPNAVSGLQQQVNGFPSCCFEDLLPSYPSSLVHPSHNTLYSLLHLSEVFHDQPPPETQPCTELATAWNLLHTSLVQSYSGAAMHSFTICWVKNQNLPISKLQYFFHAYTKHASGNAFLYLCTNTHFCTQFRLTGHTVHEWELMLDMIYLNTI